MKRLLSLVAWLLLCVLALSACQPSEETTKKPATPTPDDEVYGYWHSDKASFALEITEDSTTAKCYSLTTGLYEYYAVQDATFVYTEADGSLTLTLEDKVYNFVYDADEDTLTLFSTNSSGEEYTTEYVRQYDAPAEHAVYNFPKFSEIDLEGLFTMPDYASFELREIALAEARMDIFSDYFSTALEQPTTITDRPAQFGDLVIIDYVGKIDGVAFSGGTADDAEISILYNSGYIPGFAEGIIGHSVGETFDVAVTFPENYGNGMGGANAVFTMTLKTIYDVRLTEEQFANYQYIIYATYEEWVEAEAEAIVGDLALTKIMDEYTVNGEIPEAAYMYFYQYARDSAYANAHAYVHYYGIDYELALSIIGYNDQTYLAQSQYVALNYLICEQIKRDQNLTWTDEEYQEQVDAFVESIMENDETITKEEAEAHVKNNLADYVNAELTCTVALNWLAETTFR
ncbi:MAG: FKBP-type peptidyl-prolyl cis-trans isomerase [Clostridia bacterium]|nr:FKBP-type peptidyl-prolyl cis-trans isomerase [Clostridia bacterium]